jgi:putative transposase
LDEIKIGERLVAIGAYCLMPNHFHILLKEITEGGISKFMEKLTTAYSKYFNKKHNHSGVLFQGRFKAEHVDNDEYLKYLFAYIHLNPVKLIEPRWRDNGIQNSKVAKSYLSDYKHSSYSDYAKEGTGVNREELTILSPEEFPEYFAEAHDFQDFVNDWLEFRAEAQIGGRALTRSVVSK